MSHTYGSPWGPIQPPKEKLSSNFFVAGWWPLMPDNWDGSWDIDKPPKEIIPYLLNGRKWSRQKGTDFDFLVWIKNGKPNPGLNTKEYRDLRRQRVQLERENV